LKFQRNGLTSEFAKYASAMSAAAIMTKVNTLLLIREPCCGVRSKRRVILRRQRKHGKGCLPWAEQALRRESALLLFCLAADGAVTSQWRPLFQKIAPAALPTV
jgi:hypothetical protein